MQVEISQPNIYNYLYNECDSIKIIDNDQNTCELYIDKNKHIVINDQKKIVGKIKDWVDDKYEIPNEYKSRDNIVLHPKTIIPLIEIELFDIAGIYCNVEPGIYREFEYNSLLDTLSQTNKLLI